MIKLDLSYKLLYFIFILYWKNIFLFTSQVSLFHIEMDRDTYIETLDTQLNRKDAIMNAAI